MVEQETRKEQRRREAEARQAKAKKLKPLKAEFEKVETEIGNFEQEKVELTQKLMDPEFFKKQGSAATEASTRLSKLDDLLEKSYTRWSELSEKIEELEA